MNYELELPWPPSVNHYKKVGRIVKTKTGKLYQQRKNTCQTDKFYFDTYIIHKQGMPLEWPKFSDSATISFEVRVCLHPPNLKRYDIDNNLKVLFDGLVRAKIIKDDSQITRLFVEKMENVKNGKVIINISPLEKIKCT